MKTLKCDLCGKEFDEFDKQENFGLHYNSIGYGSKFDGESIDVDMCCDCFDKMISEYIAPQIRIIRRMNGCNNGIDLRLIEGDWNYDMRECPLDTIVYLLSADDFPICPEQAFVGTITHNGRFRARGECYQGNPEYFYRSAIIAWQPYNENLK